MDKASVRKTSLWLAWGLISMWAAAVFSASVIGTVEAGREADPVFSASWILDVDSGSPTPYRFLSRAVCVNTSPGLFGVLGLAGLPTVPRFAGLSRKYQIILACPAS